MKPTKPSKNAHTAKTQYGSGDFYGGGIKQPTGRSILSQLDFGKPAPKQLKKPPKSLA